MADYNDDSDNIKLEEEGSCFFAFNWGCRQPHFHFGVKMFY